MDRPFEVQLEKLKTKLIKMCSLVDEQVEFTIRAVQEENENLAVLVLERDYKVDRYDIKIERICQKLFALNQPVAMDLRLIMSALKINSNLERIGDLAVNIARYFIEMKTKPEFFGKIRFSESAYIAREMIKNAIDAFIEKDADLAKKVLLSDDKLDDIVMENSNILMNLMKGNPAYVENALRYYSIFREIERLGDHATNIAEEVYFIVKAETIKHRQDEVFSDDDSEGY